MGLFSRDDDSGAGGGSTGDDEAIWQGRGFVASVIVVGAVLVCLLVWFFARGNNTPASQPSAPTTRTAPTEQPTEEPTGATATPPAEPTGTTTPPPPRPKPGHGGCKTLNPDQRIPRTTPTAVTWEFEADMLIPTQQEGGPAVMNSAGVRSCFAHSPTGAVLAALVTLGQIRNPDLTIPVLRERFVPNQGLQLALAEGKATPPTPGQTKTVAQFTAFKVLDYLPNRAIIAIAVRIDDKNVASIPVTMSWSKGDWKGVLQTDGSFNGSTEPDLLQSMTGYVRFGGA